MKRATEMGSLPTGTLPFIIYQQPNNITSIPEDLTLAIFANLSIRFSELLNASRVCKYWNNYLLSEDFGLKKLTSENKIKNPQHPTWLKTYWLSSQTLYVIADCSTSMRNVEVDSFIKEIAKPFFDNKMDVKLGYFATTAVLIKCTSESELEAKLKNKSQVLTDYRIDPDYSNVLPMLKEIKEDIDKVQHLKYETHLYSDCDLNDTKDFCDFFKMNLINIKNLTINIYKKGGNLVNLDPFKNLANLEKSNLTFKN